MHPVLLQLPTYLPCILLILTTLGVFHLPKNFGKFPSGKARSICHKFPFEGAERGLAALKTAKSKELVIKTIKTTNFSKYCIQRNTLFYASCVATTSNISSLHSAMILTKFGVFHLPKNFGKFFSGKARSICHKFPFEGAERGLAA